MAGLEERRRRGAADAVWHPAGAELCMVSLATALSKSMPETFRTGKFAVECDFS